MGKFFDWCHEKECEITWFLIGFLLCSGFEALGRGKYITATINFVLIVANYFLYRKN